MVYMTIEIVNVLRGSYHAFTGAVNARQARVAPRMHCKEYPVQTSRDDNIHGRECEGLHITLFVLFRAVSI
jgi:hypothetical protein